MIYVYSTPNLSIRTMIQDVIYSYLEDYRTNPCKGVYLESGFPRIPAIEPNVTVYGCDFREGDIILFMTEYRAFDWELSHAPKDYQLIQVDSDLLSRLTTRYNMSVCADYSEDD